MRVSLKGVHSAHATLADGTKIVYWYAWRGGPRIYGEPGTPEFMASYNAAVAQRVPSPEGRMQSLMDWFQTTGEFRTLRERTKTDYVKQISLIEQEFATFPIKALAARETRGVFKDWRDKLALKSVRQADYAWTVLARIFSVAKDRGRIVVNPCERGGRLYNATRVDSIWSIDDEAAFLQRAPAHLHLALLLALWTGKRQGDLLRLPWSAYDGTHIRLRQSKTGARVVIPVGAPLKVMLAATTKHSIIMLTNHNGQPWTADGFRTSWRRACAAAGVTGVTFHDLRGTAVTRLALAGCTEAEIATITGHSLRSVRAIIDTHYLSRDPALAESAIRKLESRTKSSN